MGKSKKESHEKLQMLHMDLYEPMQVESINRKRYILVIVDDHSHFTWVKFLRTKDEAPESIIKFLKQAQDLLHQPMFDEYFKPPSAVSTIISTTTLPPPDTARASSSTTIDQDDPSPSTSQKNETKTTPIQSTNVEEPNKEKEAEFDNQCDDVDIPMVERSKLDEDPNGTLVDPTRYRSMVSSLMYLTASRPDQVFSVSMCTRYQAKPTEKHLTAVKLMKIMYVAKNLGKIQSQLTNYGFDYNKIPLYCDSKCSIALSCNTVQHSKMKHIAVRYHFIKEQVENEIVELNFVKTAYQLADHERPLRISGQTLRHAEDYV
ncbi:copia protein [Tanacetum coccineum]